MSQSSPVTETLLALAKDCELYAKVIKGIIVVDNETCANERREPRATLLKAAAALRGLAQCPDLRKSTIEECAKVAEQFHRWIGSADQANAFDKEGIAARIRALSDTSTERNSG